MNGILPLYKPRGMTSHDCDAQLRRLFHTRRVGHGGTLDPNVDGVLPICIGTATKVVDYLVAGGKTYQGEVTLGFATTTEDLDGEVFEKTPLTAAFSTAQIDAQMQTFIGTITQIPPMFSAVKVKGRRLYDYARAGETVERPQRQVTLTDFKRLNEPEFDAVAGTQKFRFEVSCSKGTYVRTLAVDLGRKLGVAAVMSALTRVQSGGFTLADTIDLDTVAKLSAEDKLATILRPMETALSAYPQVELTAEQWAKVQNGAFLPRAELTQLDEVIALVYDQKIKALYRPHPEYPHLFQPVKMFLANE
ncbi:MAG: tRNA pseudouridine(55) synthase TruB [Loigolactobacillus coryniformis]|uniref:tRNA pseudouridine(55) synthase TruB n=1 Tax=Loigolactobacillus coryniformis TaxID=1610 RepID=UPI0026486021|nr:tRNA pseudouridine(55) synthase TruB [Loigolactobacillus coryniformis]MDN5952476.1 tRNA pseudouridine(55) synthase TruB [Loigolactobacillus coryniformis]